ncbi:MAG: CPBP family intramembrane metalloprotease [Myxococcaceae bacterium]
MSDSPRRLFWKTAAVLWGASVVGVVLVLPYATSLQQDKLALAAEKSHLPVPALLAISVLQTSIYVAVLVSGGLWAASKLELRTPLITAWLTRAPSPPKGTLAIAAGVGLVSGLALVAADHFVFAPLPAVQALMHAADAPGTKPGRLLGLMASFYGAIDEEVMLRLGLLSLLALGVRALGRLAGAGREVALPSAAFWLANVLSALLFGIGHLPATAALVPLSTAVVIRAIVLNGSCGIVFGALFRRYGLEWAMVAHFCVDLVLHVAAG